MAAGSVEVRILNLYISTLDTAITEMRTTAGA
jgi:hypothetical protein